MTEHKPGAHAHVEEEFSLPLFLFTVAASLAGLAALLRLVAPASVWDAQRSASLWHFAAAFLAMHLLTCFVEYVFHRYVLHKPVVPFLNRFYKQHTLHHSLTRIGRRTTPGGRTVPFVENVYPVTEPEQGEASFFPWYTLAVFAALVTPLLAVLQWLAPAFPWFFAGYAAFAFALALYEIFHAIEHWPFERWAPLIEHRRFGWLWRRVYSFHLRHHAVIDCNEAISGFFTLPVFDWLFGTFILPKSLYVHGSEWNPAEFKSPRPCALIRWCDARSDSFVQARRDRAKTVAALPAAQPYTRGETIANVLTHRIGLASAIAAFVLLAVFAALRSGALEFATAAIFGASLVAAYAAFVDLRRSPARHWRQLFHRYNHVALFLLIGGTATPFLLGSLRGAWGWSLFAAGWTLCLFGVVARLHDGPRMKALSRCAYLLLGVLGLIAVKPFVQSVPAGALWLLLAGSLCYAFGTVFHLWQRLRYHQVVRHAFAIGGTTCHLIAVLVFVLSPTL